MRPEPRTQHDYGARPVEAARRALVDLGQVLGSWVGDSIVVVGWVPDLVLPGSEEPHVGSIDVDLALDADGCAAAFLHPERVPIAGKMISGVENRVHVLVASVPDFLIMKAYALAGRDKPKDAYDICFCLDNAPGGIEGLARDWRERRDNPLVAVAVRHLREKFATVSSFGPKQVAIFHDAASREEQERRSRRAYELAARFLVLIG